MDLRCVDNRAAPLTVGQIYSWENPTDRSYDQFPPRQLIVLQNDRGGWGEYFLHRFVPVDKDQPDLTEPDPWNAI